MGDNRSTTDKYTDLSASFAPTVRDTENRLGTTFDQLFNDYNRNAQMMGKFAGQAQNALDPEAFLRQSQNWFDFFSQTVQGPSSQLQQALNEQAKVASQDAMNAIGGQFANEGALHSSAALRALGKGAAEPLAQAQLQTQQNQLGLTGSLWDRMMGGLQAGNLARGQNQLGLAQLYGNQAGNLQNALANLATQGFMIQQPQLSYNPNAWENFMGGASDVLNLGAGAVGTGIGAATGIKGLL